MLNYKYIGNLNDYIIENLYHEPINQIKRIEKENNVTDLVAYNNFIIDLLEFKRESSKENKVRSEPIKKTQDLSHPRTPSDMSIDKGKTERTMTPFLNRVIANNNVINPTTPKAPKKREREEEREYKNKRPLKRRLFRQKGGEYGKKYKEYIENLYLYDNHHDFHSNSRGDKALPTELLLINSKKIKNNLSKTEKVFFIKALCDLNDDNPLLFTKYYFIKNSNSKHIFSNKGKNLEIIDNIDFKIYLNNNLNFINNRTVYDGKVTGLSGKLKDLRNIIEEYKQEITAEIIFDPMNTKKEHYNEMNQKLLQIEYLTKFSNLSNSVFNTGNDMVSAFNDNTRKYFNIVYYKTNKKNNYSVALLFINKERNLYKNILNINQKLPFLKFIKKIDSGNYIEEDQKNINSSTYIALDIVNLHINIDHQEINSVKNIKDMIHIIYHNKIKELNIQTFKYYLVNYIYQNEEEKTNAVNILFDLKKAGDYGKVLLCHYNNKNDNYNEKYLLSTNDTLCALNGILRKNINVVFGTTENGDKNLCFYACCNDNYNILHLKNILESTFKETIDIGDNDIKTTVNTRENANIINQYIENLKEIIIKKYKNDIIKALLPKGRNKGNLNIETQEKETDILLSKLNNTINDFIKNINNIKTIDKKKYVNEHRLIFNKYITVISDLISIYDILIINKTNTITTLKKYFTLLNNPIKQLKILIPKENDRASIIRYLSTLDNYLERNDKDVYFRANAITNYYLIKSRDVIRYINHLILLLNIFINKIIKNGDENDDFNNIIYNLYHHDINKIYNEIFINKKANYNNQELKKYLNVIIITFREYLLAKYNNNNKSENKSVLLKILSTLEYFENDFNNIIDNIKNIKETIDKCCSKRSRSSSSSISPISPKKKKQKTSLPKKLPSKSSSRSPILPNSFYIMNPPRASLPKRPYSLINPPGKIPDIKKSKASLPNSFYIMNPPKASLPKDPFYLLNPPGKIPNTKKSPASLPKRPYSLINPPGKIPDQKKSPASLPKRPYSLINPPGKIPDIKKSKASLPNSFYIMNPPKASLPKDPFYLLNPPGKIPNTKKSPASLPKRPYSLINPPGKIPDQKKSPASLPERPYSLINPPKTSLSKEEKPN